MDIFLRSFDCRIFYRCFFRRTLRILMVLVPFLALFASPASACTLDDINYLLRSVMGYQCTATDPLNLKCTGIFGDTFEFPVVEMSDIAAGIDGYYFNCEVGSCITETYASGGTAYHTGKKMDTNLLNPATIQSFNSCFSSSAATPPAPAPLPTSPP
jgi:hypothetical protein